YRGDALLLCVDGFWEYVLEKEMEDDLEKSGGPQLWLSAMESRITSRARADHDNFTAIAINFTGATAPRPPRSQPVHPGEQDRDRARGDQHRPSGGVFSSAPAFHGQLSATPEGRPGEHGEAGGRHWRAVLALTSAGLGALFVVLLALILVFPHRAAILQLLEFGNSQAAGGNRSGFGKGGGGPNQSGDGRVGSGAGVQGSSADWVEVVPAQSGPRAVIREYRPPGQDQVRLRFLGRAEAGVPVQPKEPAGGTDAGPERPAKTDPGSLVGIVGNIECKDYSLVTSETQMIAGRSVLVVEGTCAQTGIKSYIVALLDPSEDKLGIGEAVYEAPEEEYDIYLKPAIEILNKVQW
ncbi:MAG TPA: hypothetical protein VI756_26490, partial [Blastocatellia bacterium]